ncbi:hypothetical protein KACHI17_03470 [Sediminibacterium sp. KACHI17]|jgi:molybdopterin synthase sulfur carrier subunit|uniref:MoaD/ThiS family protein n=1 Tax=Sediminibacterium sp. KACHI17 TaxID=1751071 RepID=A0AAT9GFS1_9BACT
MKTSVLFFGQLIEIIGAKQLELEGHTDIQSLITMLHQQYPLLKQSKYVIAINQEVISHNRKLEENSVVAFMPPFSGG